MSHRLSQDQAPHDEHSLVFAGHSNFITAVAGYDLTTSIKPDEMPSTIPDTSLAASSSLFGGLFEVFEPPIEPPQARQTDTRFEVEYPPQLDRHDALDKAIAGISALLRLQREAPLSVQLVRSVEDLRSAKKTGAFATVLHLADADAIDSDLQTLLVLYALGLRSLAITWSRQNAFGYGVPYQSPGTPDIGPGLTEAGVRLVKACNELGIMIDLAHLNEAGFWDVAKHSTAPLVVTHGAAHALSPTSRAFTDRQMAAIADSGGVIGISLEGVMPSPAGIISDMMRQVQYVMTIVGPDGVALGTDLFRKPDSQHPRGTLLLAELFTALQDQGFDEATVAKISHVNWMRVLGRTW